MFRTVKIGICFITVGIILLLFSLPAEIFFAVLAVLMIAVGICLLCSSR